MSKRRCFVIFGVVLIGIVLTAGHFGKAESNVATNSDRKITYPETRRDDQVDEFHGVKVADPYRWLEADVRESSEVADWVAAQNKVARAYLDAIPERPAIARRLTELYDYERYSAADAARRQIFLLEERRLAEPVGSVCCRPIRCGRPRARGSERMVGGRHRGDARLHGKR